MVSKYLVWFNPSVFLWSSWLCCTALFSDWRWAWTINIPDHSIAKPRAWWKYRGWDLADRSSKRARLDAYFYWTAVVTLYGGSLLGPATHNRAQVASLIEKPLFWTCQISSLAGFSRRTCGGPYQRPGRSFSELIVTFVLLNLWCSQSWEFCCRLDEYMSNFYL